MSLKVGLIGFGKTGSLVAKEIVADAELDLRWVCRRQIPENFQFASHALGFDTNFAPFVETKNINEVFLKQNPVDLVIDFSSSEASRLFSLFTGLGVRIVSAISHYSQKELEVLKEASKKSAVLYSPNITLGINWLLIASKVLRKMIPHADVEIVEEHFRGKSEVSGTAMKLAQQLDLDADQHVNSVRVGGIVGRHEVIFGLPYQTIRLTHESINRSAFGTGAAFAGKWLVTQPPGMYSMEKLFKEKFIDHVRKLEF
jgi:4-hydroxy-tetrahydrodipicolinate reductase